MIITKYKLCMNEERQSILVKENAENYRIDNIKDPCTVVKMMNEIFNVGNMSEEFVYALSLKINCMVSGVFEISHGTVKASLISPREIMIRMLLSGASMFILVHNHPSGDCSPSREDISITKKISEAAKLIDIPMVDHIVIGEAGKYYSFKESGFL